MATFVLVPGAWLGGWVWQRVGPGLQKRGHGVYPVTLSGMGERVHLASPDLGIETAIQDVMNVLEYNDLDDVVLVGHSFAGKVVAPVADRAAERVKEIVYLDALRPQKVRTPQARIDPSEFGAPKAGQLGIPLTEAIIDTIGKDVNGADREWLLSKATPWPLRLMSDPITLSAKFDSVKSAYIFCRDSGDPVDDIIQGKWGKLDGAYRVIDSGHWPMITRPDDLVEDLLALSV